ncbi:MAG TPA: EAL domain-containing protein [Solirubrobacterales bacterium]|nr:EAL domain-containing protein [Solirubrobacterales bacterium]
MTQHDTPGTNLFSGSQLIEALDASVIVMDLDRRITDWSHGAEFLYGWSAEEAVGQDFVSLIVPPEMRDEARALTGSRGLAGYEDDYEMLRRDGSTFMGHMRTSVITDDEGNPVAAASLTIDLTRRIEAKRDVVAVGDHMRAVAECMTEGLFVVSAEGSVTFMNSSGAELLGWDETDLEGKNIHDIVYHRHVDGSLEPHVGCPILPAIKQGETVRSHDDLFSREDGSTISVDYTAAPFVLDGNPDASIVVFSDITPQKRRDQELQAQVDSLSELRAIRTAIEDDRLLAYAQPVISLKSGEAVMHELLIRIEGEDHIPVPPSEFLPVAEEFGLIGELDRWMIDQAVGLAALGHRVTVNLSAHSLVSPTLIGHFRSALSTTGADAKLVVVEVTETALLSDQRAARDSLVEIRDLGCQVAIDDFGSGYGGFTYLKHFSADLLKIDREFVTDLTSNTRSQNVVRAVVSLAKSFELETIAEGVEDAETVTALRGMEVDFAQGYLFAKPKPVTTVFRGDRDG